VGRPQIVLLSIVVGCAALGEVPFKDRRSHFAAN
jgi:hypothetical protein